MDTYKEWAFQLHPGVSTADLFLKCDKLGATSRVKNYMQELRSMERDRYLVSVMHNNLFMFFDMSVIRTECCISL